MKCRICGSCASQVFVDLGHQPPSNAYLTSEQLELPEITFPLRVFVCNECWLVQLPAHASASDLFTESYAYFSSVSSTWLEHAARYVNHIVQVLGLNSKSFVLEIASNDGYLLQFVQERGIRCLGVEPTASTAKVSRDKGIDTIQEFFGVALARRIVEEHGRANLLVANNVLAHVPDLNDFVAGVAIALDKEGVATFEFPHLMQLVRGRQFDTIYHEHYSYLSFHAVLRLLASHEMRVFDVEELATHGGSLRVYAASKFSRYSPTSRVEELLAREISAGMQTPEYYSSFQGAVEEIKNDLMSFLIRAKRGGSLVCGYGAAAKGNTLLNFAGVKPDLMPMVCDAAVSKQGKFLPGSHIPIVNQDQLRTSNPDEIIILPWNLATEVIGLLDAAKIWPRNVRVAIPRLRTLLRGGVPVRLSQQRKARAK